MTCSRYAVSSLVIPLFHVSLDTTSRGLARMRAFSLPAVYTYIKSTVTEFYE